MKVLNVHRRIINQPIDKISNLLNDLATKNDAIWPYEQWPRMKFKDGLVEGAAGGHGFIRYWIEKYNPSQLIQFRFTRPVGFNGIHKLEISQIDNQSTELTHTIDVNTAGITVLTWPLFIRPLHDALIEDAFDKLENRFLTVKKTSKWSLWVRTLRKILGA